MDILQDIYAGAVIAAGGMAQRMQGINKQSLMIQGVPVLVRSIQRMAEVKQIRQIVVVARPELFLKKYESYPREDGLYQTIELHCFHSSNNGRQNTPCLILKWWQEEKAASSRC